MKGISASVGKNGVNRKVDVDVVQKLLKDRGLYSGKVDGICGPKSIGAIQAFQKKFMHHPDGLVEPGGMTWKKLTTRGTAPLPVSPAVAGQWAGDSSRWPLEKKLRSLNSTFRAQVETVLEKLRSRGFQPKLFYAWRSVAVQLELFNKGNSKVRFSFHNAQLPDGTPNSYAADIVDERWGWGVEAERNGF
jgi:peptidoglycan hydrolase-like protein with peptidoglycan-binding domain